MQCRSGRSILAVRWFGGLGLLSFLGLLSAALLLPLPASAQETDVSSGDAGGTTSSQTASTGDTTPPVIHPRDHLVVAAVDEYGTELTYGPPQAFDDVDGEIQVACNGPQNVRYPVGQTTITCYAEDRAGNDAEPFSFIIAVVDQHAPAIADRENIVVEAADANGREIEFARPRAFDNVDGEFNAACDWASPATFPLGDTKVTCYAEDRAGNDAQPVTFWVSVVDTTSPTLGDRENIAVAAADASGRVVEFGLPRAVDRVDGDVPVGCTAGSGDRFPLGTTTVTCYAEDRAGNDASSTTFSVTVVDTERPVIYGRDSIAVSAVDASGRVVEFGLPQAVDDVDGEVPVSCDAASGARFSLGMTTVTCSAQDRAGNAANPVAFGITVADSHGPVIAQRSDIAVQASSSAGQVVTFGMPQAYDNVDGEVGVGCDPAPGARFAVGQTVVTCYATDRAGNNATPVSFRVAVSASPVVDGGVEAPDGGVPAEPTKPVATDTSPNTETPDRPDGGIDAEIGTPKATEATQTGTGETTTSRPTVVATAAINTRTGNRETYDLSEDLGEPDELGEFGEDGPSLERVPLRPTPEAMELPTAPDLFFPVGNGGPINGIAGIWGNKNFGISQEFGHTAFSIAHNSWYSYGTRYGLDGYEHPGLDISMPRGNYLYSPVNGTVVISGGTPYFTYYGNGQPGVGELLIQTDEGHQVILGHMARITVRAGERVQAGQFVGLSGGANGDHLHLETRERHRGGGLYIVDPRNSFLVPFMARQAQGVQPSLDQRLIFAVGIPLGQLVAVTVERATDASLTETDNLPVTGPVGQIRETTSGPVVETTNPPTRNPVAPPIVRTDPPVVDPVAPPVVTTDPPVVDPVAPPVVTTDPPVVVDPVAPPVSSSDLILLPELEEDPPVVIVGDVEPLVPVVALIAPFPPDLGNWVPSLDFPKMMYP